MIIPNNWNEIEPVEAGEFKNLVPGAYICKIMDVREYKSEQSGNISLKVCVDICEGEYRDFFQKQYDNNTLSERKWPSGATRYLSLREDQMTYLKGFITAVENTSKKQLKVQAGKELDYEQFKGLKVVGVFGYEEWKNDKNEIKLAIKLTSFRSLDKINEISDPKVKLLDGTYTTMDDYEEMKEDRRSNSPTQSNVDKMIEDAGITL